MKIAIVGGGIAGMAAAYALQRSGHDVTIYEANEKAGGRGQLLNRPGTDDWADVGSQYFHSNYKRALKLIDDLGLSGELKKIEGKTRFFADDGSTFLLDPRFPLMPPGGILGNLRIAFYLIKLVILNRLNVFGVESWPKLDAITGLDSTPHKFVQDYVVRTLVLTGALNEPARSNVSVLQIVRLIRIILMTDYMSLKDGTASLHQALAKHLDIRFETPVERVLLEDDKIIGIETRRGEVVYADHVIVAAHGPKAADLVPEDWRVEKFFLANIEMPPAIIVSFFLDRALEDKVWSYYLPLNGGTRVSFCVDTQQKNPDNTPSGKATLQAWIISPHAISLVDATDAVICDVALTDLQTHFPKIREWVESTHVTRHAMAVPQAPTGHNAQVVKFLESADQRDGVSFCGDYMSGGYMEAALWSVERAVSQLQNFKNDAR